MYDNFGTPTLDGCYIWYSEQESVQEARQPRIVLAVPYNKQLQLQLSIAPRLSVHIEIMYTLKNTTCCLLYLC